MTASPGVPTDTAEPRPDITWVVEWDIPNLHDEPWTEVSGPIDVLFNAKHCITWLREHHPDRKFRLVEVRREVIGE